MSTDSFMPDTAKRGFFYIYSVALLLPAIYRLYLPDPLGDFLFYGVAFATPAAFACLWILFNKLEFRVLLSLLAIVAMILLSWIVASTDLGGVTALLYGLKTYLVPILIFILGYTIANAIDRTAFVRLIVAVILVQLMFSLVYYFDLLDNPMYRVLSGRFSENWVVTAGDMKAFIGLTLSKFDLAYQIGFLLVGLFFSRNYFKINRVAYFLCIIIGVILIIFTYNKTIMVVLLLAASISTYRLARSRTRVWAYLWISSLAVVVVFFAVAFLTMQISFADTYKFLTPQTFWSRVFGWYEAFHYDSSCLFRGYGAGFFDIKEIILDSQYLYTYLELGLIGAVGYFWLFGYILYQYSTKDLFARTFILLLFVIFIGGDTLGALTVTYIGGLYFGQFRRQAQITDYANETYENRR